MGRLASRQQRADSAGVAVRYRMWWALMLCLWVVGCVADPIQPVDAGVSEVVDPYGDKDE